MQKYAGLLNDRAYFPAVGALIIHAFENTE